MARRGPDALAGYPRTSRSGSPSGARCPRSVHGPGAVLRPDDRGSTRPISARAASGLAGLVDQAVPVAAGVGITAYRDDRAGVRPRSAGRHDRGRPAPPPDMKCPEEPSILGRVPQSKLRRSQGFGPSAPSGKDHYAPRTGRRVGAYPRPSPIEGLFQIGFPPLVHRREGSSWRTARPAGRPRSAAPTSATAWGRPWDEPAAGGRSADEPRPGAPAA
jgi:hypothetical protein